MLVQKIDHIETHQEILRFETHISQKDNKRIIFSAPYGSGKTYFLEKFFKKFNDTYNPVFINPVKYSVSDNKDIFELVKVDIILQCLERGYLKATKSVNDFDKVSNAWFLKDNPLTILGALAKAIPNISAFDPASLIAKVIASLPEIKKLHQDYIKQKASELKTTEEELTAFITQFTETKGTIYEQDEITYLIRELLKKAKENNKANKQSVLIIDDFDRLDPEHIFRILNILSVHNDSFYTDNKFGFDKIIIVCDIDGLEKIFKHRYGPSANFEGYMDKFCSTHYYCFSIENDIYQFLKSKAPSDLNIDSNDEFGKQLLLLSAVLAYFIRAGKLTMRKIVKANFDFKLVNKQLVHSTSYTDGYTLPHIRSNDIYVDTHSIRFFKTLKSLVTIWGDIKLLKYDLKNVVDSEFINDHFTDLEVIRILEGIAVAKLLAVHKDTSQLVFTQFRDGTTSQFPEVPVCSFKCQVYLGFTGGSPYHGDQCLFQNAKGALLNYNGGKKTNFKALCTELLEIIKGFETKGYLVDFDFK
ncbi:MAG: P-loop NTPase fold protein [Chitinophagales bacterium]